MSSKSTFSSSTSRSYAIALYELSRENSEINKVEKDIKSLDELSEIPFILIANEFFDALPIKQIQMTRNGWRERMVNYNKEKKKLFYFLLKQPDYFSELFTKKE